MDSKTFSRDNVVDDATLKQYIIESIFSDVEDKIKILSIFPKLSIYQKQAFYDLFRSETTRFNDCYATDPKDGLALLEKRLTENQLVVAAFGIEIKYSKSFEDLCYEIFSAEMNKTGALS